MGLTITRRDVGELCVEAAKAGDLLMVEICNTALGGSAESFERGDMRQGNAVLSAWRKCLNAIEAGKGARSYPDD